MRVSGWGRYPQVETTCLDMRDVEDARAALAANASLIARGNGRSYGDAALNPSCVQRTFGSTNNPVDRYMNLPPTRMPRWGGFRIPTPNLQVACIGS